MKLALLGFWLPAFAGLTGCSERPAIETETIRIVSLNPCTDAILAEIAPEKLAAVSHYSHDPAASSMDVAKARRWPATAGTVEEIAALEPDLVVASTFLSPATSQAFERLGFRVARIGMTATVEDSIAQIRELAALAEAKDEGERLVAEIEAALAAANGTGDPVPALVWQAGGIVPGEGTLIVDLLRRTGFAHAAAARGLGQADRLPLEAVLADPPALILAAGSAHAEQDRALFHPALAALEDTRRARLDPSLLYCGGPTIIRAAERLAEIRADLPSRRREGLGVGMDRARPIPLRLGRYRSQASLPLPLAGGGV